MFELQRLEQLFGDLSGLSSEQRSDLRRRLDAIDVASRLSTSPAESEDEALHAVMFGASQSLNAIRRRQLQSAQAQLTELALSNEALEAIGLTDALTGLPNRRAFDRELAKACAQSDEGRVPLSLAMIDIDFFKALNDRLGHPGGDVCLQKVGQALQAALSGSNNIVARYGGEEFCVIMPQISAVEAHQLASKLRRTVQELQLPYPDPSSVTVSVGVATVKTPDARAAYDLIGRADRALYDAKKNGRNRVESA